MDATTASLTLHRLRELYLDYALTRYRRRAGEPTREHLNMRAVLDRYVAFAGAASPAAKINRHQARAWMDQLAAERLSRVYCNQCLSRLRRWVKWGVEFDYVPREALEELRLVRPLARFRSPARESDTTPPPALDQIDRVIPFLPNPARDVLRLHRLTGARPSEILALTNAEIHVDDAGARLVPIQHKNAHHGHLRIIPLSTEALAIVALRWKPLLPAERIFESEKSRRRHYTIEGFRKALARACREAGVRQFTPREVRRAVARHVRKHRGLDAAQALLGHTSASTTEIYAPLAAGDARTLEAARSAAEVLR
jgi:integrase